jgi:hypothetical protein
MVLQNEYLIIIDKDSAPGFYSLCNNIKRFNEFIEKNGSFNIKNKKIHTSNDSFDYNVKMGKVKGKEQQFFYLTIIFNGDENKIGKFKNLLRDIKSTLHGNQTIIETLKDDLSFYYSQKAYSLIHEIENLMRKFITYFMITNVGKNWIEESSPEPIKDALKKSKRKQYIDVLQQLDFIHLGDFLFKSYQDEDISSLFEKIEALKEEEPINIENLKGHIPKSNWDKYFKEKVECDDKYLKSRWEKLYELRNKIAHTSHFTEGDFQDIKNLVDDVKEKLEQAFENINNIEIPEEEKEQLSENIAINTNEYIGKYLSQWNKLEKQIHSITNDDSNKIKSFNKYLYNLEKTNNFNKDFINQLEKMKKVRNEIVHDINFTKNNNLHIYLKELEKLNAELQYSWKEEIIKALHELGGSATLDEIYDYIEKNTTRKLADSWKSSIRKTIYLYSSDTEVYLGKEDLFERIDKGKWKLRD